MERHSSYFFVWLQLELCAMAVLLTKGKCRGRGARAPPGSPAPKPALVRGAGGGPLCVLAAVPGSV